MKQIDKEDCEYIGFVRKVGGFHGELMLAIENGQVEDYESIEFFFIELEGGLVPFAVEAISLKRGDFIVKFEDVDDDEEAKKLLTKKVFVENLDIIKEASEFSWTDFEGYIAIDDSVGELGVIKSIEEYPQQWLATCIVKGKEVLIPLNDETVIMIDLERKMIHLDLPEGLIDLYLG